MTGLEPYKISAPSEAPSPSVKLNDPVDEWLSIDHARYNREWAYSQVARKVVIEKMLSKDGGIPWDYRCFVFNGRLSHIIIDTRTDDQGYSATYSRSWERLPFYDPNSFLGDSSDYASIFGRSYSLQVGYKF